jgi:serine/threonine protein kinase
MPEPKHLSELQRDQATEPRMEDQIDTKAESLQTTLPEISPAAMPATPTENRHHDHTMRQAASAGGSAAASGSLSLSGVLGRFHYVRNLGEGAFGSVLLVWDPELQTHRAVKVPHRHLIDSGRVNPESYVDEARKIAQLGKHAGIVDVLDVQRMENGTPYVVSEYVAGGSLADRIKAGRMSWRDAVTLVARAAEAVAHAHSKGIVHRDLKPGNILLTEKGEPVVADFGLALGDDEFSYQSSVCGTYQYMSPQQVRGEADRVDGRADVYSLGVILYQLLAGRMPYKSRDVPSLKREILEDAPTPVRQYNPEVPADVEKVCERAMAKELKDRYRTAGDFANALRAALTKEEHASAPQLVGAGSRSTGTWLPILVGAAALGAFGLFLMSRSSHENRSATVPTATSPIVELAAPELEINIQKADQDGPYQGLMVDKDLPLAVGDRLQFHLLLPEPQYVYIYWIDYDGLAQRYWPRADADLSQQLPVKELWSPDGADAGSQAAWWSVESTGGPEVVFVGVSDVMLSQAELDQVESRASFMTNLLGGDRLKVETVYPDSAKTYIREGGATYVARGGSKVPVISPKTFATDHTELVKYFTAYHAWIFQTEQPGQAVE